MSRFPTSQHGPQHFKFFPAPFDPPETPFAALLFAWEDDRVLAAQIVNRGWCVPSGKVEAGETTEDAIRREAMEEAGASLTGIRLLGCFHIVEGQQKRWAACFTARIESLVEIQRREESREIRMFGLHELPSYYYLWDDLIEAVFRFSLEQVNAPAV